VSTLGVKVSQTPTLDELVDAAAAAYWDNRPDTRWCGSEWGYRLHLRDGTDCEVCRTAHAQRRYARAHGIPVTAVSRRRLEPCGSHAAFVRHKAAGEDPCDACWVAERKYHRDYKRARRAALTGT
jgi:hypothetical protein